MSGPAPMVARRQLATSSCGVVRINLYEAALLFDEGHFVREVGLNWL